MADDTPTRSVEPASTTKDTVCLGDDQFETRTHDDLPRGEAELVAGRYRIVRRLGEGGMATVFLADDTELGEQVAMKIPRHTDGDDGFVKRFVREGRAVETINHPHVCGFRDIGEHHGRLFLTMDYLPGGTLAEWMQNAPEISEESAIEIASKVARGVQAAHEAGIVHRDLKAGNIMMSDQGEPVVTDFGMASWSNVQETVLTPSGAMIGTPGYMSPEQITCDKEKIGPATDVYGLGVILYELLTGWMPFSGNLAALLGAVVSDPPPPLSKHTPGIDPRLEALVLKALEKAPEDRFADAAGFADALDNYRNGASTADSGLAGPARPSGYDAQRGKQTGLLSKLFGRGRRGAGSPPK